MKYIEGNLTRPRTFCLWRYEDISGVSGDSENMGKPVAWGCYFPESGTAVVHWTGKYPTTTVHEQGFESIEAINGHEGATVVAFDDSPGVFVIPPKGTQIS